MNKKIAFVIHNMVLYHTIKNLYNELIKRQFSVEIFIADNVLEQDWLDMADDTYNALINHVRVFKSSEYQGDEYDVGLYPYLPYQFEVKSKFNIRYQYGIAKPVWNFKADTLLFDFCLCYGNYDYSFLRHYCQAQIVGNLKYAHLSSSLLDVRRSSKKTAGDSICVLYLPTYGKESSFDLIINDLLSLPENCQIKIKLHHGTEFLESRRKEQIRQLPNVQIYGQNDLLEELLLDSDLVISDGSSACFDAIYFCKPLILAGECFGDDFYGEEPITKQLFTKYGIVRYNSDECTLIELVNNTLVDTVYLDKISELREYFFPVRGQQSLDMVIDVINNLTERNTVEYQSVRKAIQSYIKNSIESSNKLTQETNDAKSLIRAQKLELESMKMILDNTQNKLNGVQDELSGVYNSRGWKFINRLRNLRNLFVKNYK